MSSPLRILPRAERDIQSIFQYIEDYSPAGARQWWDAFCEAALRASDSPLQFPVAPENPMSAVEVRQFLFGTRRGRTYRAVFTVIDEEVHILRVRGPGQPPLIEDELQGP